MQWLAEKVLITIYFVVFFSGVLDVFSLPGLKAKAL